LLRAPRYAVVVASISAGTVVFRCASVCPMTDGFDLARAPRGDLRMGHGGWAYDAYPELETLDAGATIVVASIEGPAVITRIHVTQHLVDPATRARFPGRELEFQALGARGVVLEITYDGEDTPAVLVPLGDFFADGCGGRGMTYSTPFVEKTPGSYNAFFPMPVRERAVVRLRNDTEHDLFNYTTVEYVRVPRWDDAFRYFHASWRRWSFPLDADTDEHVVTLRGPGHLVGQSWSIATDAPHFRGFIFVMEGNNELRIDGATEPTIDYLGTEDAFGFSWGFQEAFAGLRNGIPFVQHRDPALLSVYRFRDNDAIRFEESLDLRIDWTNEFRSPLFHDRVAKRFPSSFRWLPPGRDEGGGSVDYATTFYWYADAPAHESAPLPSLDERVAVVLPATPA
jgi:DUF2961 family protein